MLPKNSPKTAFIMKRVRDWLQDSDEHACPPSTFDPDVRINGWPLVSLRVN